MSWQLNVIIFLLGAILGSIIVATALFHRRGSK